MKGYHVMNKQKIIIFSVSFGNGHNQVAGVLRNQLVSKNFNVEIIDIFDVISKMFHKVILESYLKLLQFRPSLWGKLYHYSEENPNPLFLKQLNIFLVNKLSTFLQKKDAFVIVTTHPIATSLLANVIRKRRLPVQLFALLTDFAVHPMSIHPEVNGYFVASEHLRFYSKLYNIDESILYTTGIPTKKQELQHLTKHELQKKLNLKRNMKTILIAGGGVGLAKFTDILASLETYYEPLQIICVTGSNKKAKSKIEKLKSKHKIRTLGFTNLFMEYLKASDVILTKAGGVTMSEALVCETPIVIFQPLPGQEEQNTQFLMNYGAAIKAEVVEEIPILLERIIFKEYYHNLMTESARKLKEPDAANQITEILTFNINKTSKSLTMTSS